MTTTPPDDLRAAAGELFAQRVPTKTIAEQLGVDRSTIKAWRVDWKNDPEEAAVNSELRSTLEGGLEVLSPDLRAAVVLRDIQGLSTEESAEALNIW